MNIYIYYNPDNAYLFDYGQLNHLRVNDDKAPLCRGGGVFGFLNFELQRGGKGATKRQIQPASKEIHKGMGGRYIALEEINLKTFSSVSSLRLSRLKTFSASFILVLSPRSSICPAFLWFISLAKISVNSLGKP